MYHNKHKNNAAPIELNEQHKRIIDFVTAEPGASQSKIIAIETKVNGSNDADVRNALAFLRKNRLVRISHGFNVYPDKIRFVTGKVTTTDRGFAFLNIEGEEEPYFIPASNAKRLMNNDVVQAVFKPAKIEGEKPTVDVLRISQSVEHTLWGTIQQHPKGYWSLTVFGPDATSADIRLAHKEHYKNGDTISLSVPANRDDRPFLEFEKYSTYLGSSDKPYFIQDLVQKMYELPDFKKFPSFQAKKIVGNKKDYKNLSFVSIDGESTKDIDDALYGERLENGDYRVYIAIADPTSFIEPGSDIEKEAFHRGVTCYLPGKKISMLPKELSEGLASLNEGQETPSIVVVNTYNAEGMLVSSRNEQAMIRNHKKLSYEKVQACIKDGQTVGDTHIDTMLNDLTHLATLIKDRHLKNGELPIVRNDPEFELDASGEIVNVIQRVEDESQKLVSTFMLEGNITIAQQLKNKGWGIYRHHPEPTEKAWGKVQETLVTHIDISDWPQKPSLSYLQSLFFRYPEHYDLLVDTVFESLVSAQYSSTKSSHFSLGVDAYTHFTSPIRRFSDFIVHRLLKGDMLKTANLLDIVTTCNERTLRAANAERSCKKMLATRFMLRNPDKEWNVEFIYANKTQIKVFIKDLGMMAFIDRTDLENKFLELKMLENGKEVWHWNGPLLWKACCTASIAIDKPVLNSVEHSLCSDISVQPS